MCHPTLCSNNMDILFNMQLLMCHPASADKHNVCCIRKPNTWLTKLDNICHVKMS